MQNIDLCTSEPREEVIQLVNTKTYKNTRKAVLQESSYQNCINFKEIDLTDGCSIGCIYCGLSKHARSEQLDINDLLNSNKIPKGLYLSPNSDPFAHNAAESTHELLRYYLPKGVNISIITKSIIPANTISLLSKYYRQVIPQISLARMNDALNNYIEPGAASANERIQNMEEMSVSGLKVRALAIPMYPGIDDTEDNLRTLLINFKKAGVSSLKAAFVLVRIGGKRKDEFILNRMIKHPELKNCLNKMTETIKAHIGDGNVPEITYRKQFYCKVAEICKEYQLKFASCSVLDPALLDCETTGFPVCKSIWTFSKINKHTPIRKNNCYVI
ncbi:hypothetical protein ACFL6G_09360 [candidate division KSB1 bacterium]